MELPSFEALLPDWRTLAAGVAPIEAIAAARYDNFALALACIFTLALAFGRQTSALAFALAFALPERRRAYMLRVGAIQGRVPATRAELAHFIASIARLHIIVILVLILLRRFL